MEELFLRLPLPFWIAEVMYVIKKMLLGKPPKKVTPLVVRPLEP